MRHIDCTGIPDGRKGSDGNLYGTTGDDGQFGGGSVFRMNPTTGVKTVLHAFGGGANQ
jgi:uncharacterized repeat protein (TIGR03803 family)